MAGVGFGSDGPFVGQDPSSGSSFVYDPWVLYQRGLITAPNIVLAGIVGSGKPALAKSLYTRSIPFGRRIYVPGEPKGEHTAVTEAVGGKAIALGHGMSKRSTRRLPVMPPETIRTLPFGTALVLLRSAPSLVTDLRPWINRREASMLKAERVDIESKLHRR